MVLCVGVAGRHWTDDFLPAPAKGENNMKVSPVLDDVVDHGAVQLADNRLEDLVFSHDCPRDSLSTTRPAASPTDSKVSFSFQSNSDN
jgi:hypothetical protein